MTGRGKLSDAELSKKLGHYQKMSRVWILVGLFGVLSGTVSYFAVQDTALKAILTGVLFFGGVCRTVPPQRRLPGSRAAPASAARSFWAAARKRSSRP